MQRRSNSDRPGRGGGNFAIVRQKLQRRDRGPSEKAGLVKKEASEVKSQRPFVKARSFGRLARCVAPVPEVTTA